MEAFEFTTELARRTIQNETVRLGYTERGPKLSLRTAIGAGLLPPKRS